eukprot:UN02595
MAPKKKKNKLVIKLVSGAGTGFFYIFKKTPAIAQKKMALRKFDPIVNQYVIFNEAKLKYHTSTVQRSPVAVPQWQPTMLQQWQHKFNMVKPFAPKTFVAAAGLTAFGAASYASFLWAQTRWNNPTLKF